MLPQHQNSSRKAKISDQKQTFKGGLTIKNAFWWPYYVKTLLLFCWTFGTTPCPTKLAQMWRKSVKVVPVNPRNLKG